MRASRTVSFISVFFTTCTVTLDVSSASCDASPAHIAFGIFGIVAYRRFDSARFYARFTAVAYGLLTVMGLIPGLNTLFGLMPIHGNDVWLHALIAIASAYFGWAPVRDTGTAPAHETAVTH